MLHITHDLAYMLHGTEVFSKLPQAIIVANTSVHSYTWSNTLTIVCTGVIGRRCICQAKWSSIRALLSKMGLAMHAVTGLCHTFKPTPHAGKTDKASLRPSEQMLLH